jgi:hypothetical protein
MNQPTKPRKMKLTTMACLLCIGLAPAIVWLHHRPSAQETERWRKEAAVLSEKLLATHHAEANRTRERIHAIIVAAQPETPRVAAQVTVPFLGFRPTAQNVWMVACDKVRGTHHFQEHVIAADQPALAWQAEVRGRMAAELAQLEQRMGAADNGFRQAVLDFSKQAGAAAPVLELDEEGFRKMLEAQKHLTAEVLGASMAAFIEALFIRTTIETICHVAGVAIGRLSQSAALAGACAFADGPLPIGDIIGVVIAVGGSVWTIYEIRQAAQAMSQLQPTMDQALQASLQKLEEDAFQRINATTVAHAAVAQIH